MPNTFAGMTLISADDVNATTGYAAAVDALEDALRRGLDPERDVPRSRVETGAGELLIMPSTGEGATGVKVISLSPGNAGTDLPVIQGAFLLFDGTSQRPTALIDGPALTNLRTPAVSALAVRHLAPTGRAEGVTILGTGPQALGHARAMLATRDVAHLSVVGRLEGAQALLAQVDAPAAEAVDRNDRDALARALAGADVICCCTSAATPLFDGSLVRDGAVVVAMGSHDPARREVDEVLVRRSVVVVESRSNALREAGDVVLPIQSGALDPQSLITLRELVHGTDLPDGPRFFKSTGMSWQDLAVAKAIHQRCGQRT